MNSDIIKLFKLQRQIFGVCTRSQNFFRLSECRIYLKKKPVKDWLDEVEDENERLDKREESISAKENERRDLARQRGRRLAIKAVRKIDNVFTGKHLNPDDAKAIFHPVDYIVFNGAKEKGKISNLIFLDRLEKHKIHQDLQKSIKRAIDKESYDWTTLRIKDDGTITSE